MTYFAYSQPNLLKLLSQPMLFIGTENSKGPQKNTVGSFFFPPRQLKKVGHTSTVALLAQGQANIKVSSLTLHSSYYYSSDPKISKRYSSQGFKATSPKLGRDLGPGVQFYAISFQTDQTYSLFIINFYKSEISHRLPLSEKNCASTGAIPGTEGGVCLSFTFKSVKNTYKYMNLFHSDKLNQHI